MGHEPFTPIPFPQHMRDMQWKQGEHVLVTSPTGGGKTELTSKLLPRRSHVVAVVTKIKDATIDREFKGWKRYREMPRGGFSPHDDRIVLWPNLYATEKRPENVSFRSFLAHQQDVIGEFTNSLLRDGNRCMYVDEGLYFSDPNYLGFSKELGMLFYTGRSHGISCVVASQRPKWFPRVVLSSVDHLYMGSTTDRDDMKSLADMGLANSRLFSQGLANLPGKHDYAYSNIRGKNTTPVVVNTRK